MTSSLFPALLRGIPSSPHTALPKVLWYLCGVTLGKEATGGSPTTRRLGDQMAFQSSSCPAGPLVFKPGSGWGSPGGSDSKEFACNAGDPGLIPESGRSPEEGNGNVLHYSCLENPMDRGAWQATVHGVTSHRWVCLDLEIGGPNHKGLLTPGPSVGSFAGTSSQLAKSNPVLPWDPRLLRLLGSQHITQAWGGYHWYFKILACYFLFYNGIQWSYSGLENRWFSWHKHVRILLRFPIPCRSPQSVEQLPVLYNRSCWLCSICMLLCACSPSPPRCASLSPHLSPLVARGLFSMTVRLCLFYRWVVCCRFLDCTKSDITGYPDFSLWLPSLGRSSPGVSLLLQKAFFQYFPVAEACAMLSHFICLWLFVTLWTVARQAPLSVGFSAQDYWRGLPWLPPGHPPNPGFKLLCFLGQQVASSPPLACVYTTSAVAGGLPVDMGVAFRLSQCTQFCLNLGERVPGECRLIVLCLLSERRPRREDARSRAAVHGIRVRHDREPEQ